MSSSKEQRQRRGSADFHKHNYFHKNSWYKKWKGPCCCDECCGFVEKCSVHTPACDSGGGVRWTLLGLSGKLSCVRGSHGHAHDSCTIRPQLSHLLCTRSPQKFGVTIFHFQHQTECAKSPFPQVIHRWKLELVERRYCTLRRKRKWRQCW